MIRKVVDRRITNILREISNRDLSRRSRRLPHRPDTPRAWLLIGQARPEHPRAQGDDRPGLQGLAKGLLNRAKWLWIPANDVLSLDSAPLFPGSLHLWKDTDDGQLGEARQLLMILLTPLRIKALLTGKTRPRGGKVQLHTRRETESSLEKLFRANLTLAQSTSWDTPRDSANATVHTATVPVVGQGCV